MRLRFRRFGVGLIVMVLTAGVVPAVAVPDPPGPAGRVSVKAVTLVTGDRVVMSGTDGKDVGIVPGEGRRHVRFHTHRKAGKLLVIPSDVEALVASGRLDRRLFDVTGLIEAGYDDSKTQSIPLIVTYAGIAGRASVRAGGAEIVRELPSINGTAVRVDKGRGLFSSLRGVERVWLDGKRRTTLDQSVPQIGAPAAWQAGYTGKGVTVAVLDTGVDNTHPDLASRVAEAKNFTETPDGDQVGHGTHVASTIAGAAGKYRGVAPDAVLLDGKVCGDIFCEESAILAGMEWAAREKKADVINMSLGAPDGPEVDPLEEAVNTLTAQTGSVFVIAAGNDGPDAGSVNSPGSADTALTVGAVDRSDQIAPFSSRGPRVGDAGVKPDVTAPGVGIVAAKSKDAVIGDPVGDQYLRLSGTSMATPHVAGAAALLVQQHPDWTAGELKSALMASAKPYAQQSVFEQGVGRVDVAKAITQTVFSQPGSLSFGTARWPHQDDTPVTKHLTFRNTGTADVTLVLQANLVGPNGDPAPAGALTLSESSVAVPAGGTATVAATSDTRHDGPDGVYAGRVSATGPGGVAVTVPLSVDRETEQYDLTVTHLDPDGKPTARASTWITGIDSDFFTIVNSLDGIAKTRLPKGRYFIEGYVDVDLGNGRFEVHTLIQPILQVDKDTALTIDARRTKRVTTTIPRPNAELFYYLQTAVLTAGPEPVGAGLITFAEVDLFTAPLGQPLPAGQFAAGLNSVWQGAPLNPPYTYHLMNTKRGEYWHGFNRAVRDSELTRLSAQHHWQAGDRPVVKFLYGYTADGIGGAAGSLNYTLPSRSVHYLEAGGANWRTDFGEFDPETPFPVTILASPYRTYRAGESYAERWNAAVFGPSLVPVFPTDKYVSRTGDQILISVPAFSDPDHAGGSRIDSGSTKLYRNGELIAESPYGSYVLAENVPADQGEFKLVSTESRPSISNLSTRVDLEWTFKSRTASMEGEALPFWAVRYAPRVDSRNTVKRQPLSVLPLRLETAPGANVGSLTKLEIKVSGDDGTTWTKAGVRRTGDNRYVAVFATPAGNYVSLKTKAADSDGNTTEQTIIRAYQLR